MSTLARLTDLRARLGIEDSVDDALLTRLLAASGIPPPNSIRFPLTETEPTARTSHVNGMVPGANW